jgi:hypothetical protein
MELLHTKTKDGKNLYHTDDWVYCGDSPNTATRLIVSDMIKVLSHNKIYPKIKFDRQFELIHDNKNNYVIGETLHSAFCNLIIKIFSQTNE